MGSNMRPFPRAQGIPYFVQPEDLIRLLPLYYGVTVHVGTTMLAIRVYTYVFCLPVLHCCVSNTSAVCKDGTAVYRVLLPAVSKELRCCLL